MDFWGGTTQNMTTTLFVIVHLISYILEAWDLKMGKS